MIVNRPVVSSIRSRQTGHVGNSMSEGVRGASGLVDRVAEGIVFDWLWEEILPLLGLFVARVF